MSSSRDIHRRKRDAGILALTTGWGLWLGYMVLVWAFFTDLQTPARVATSIVSFFLLPVLSTVVILLQIMLGWLASRMLPRGLGEHLAVRLSLLGMLLIATIQLVAPNGSLAGWQLLLAVVPPLGLILLVPAARRAV